MHKGVIYKYTFPNGKVYIGQTINPRSRKSQHLCASTGARNVAFWRALKKYGTCEYEEIVAVVSDSAESLTAQLNELEQKYIAEYDSMNPAHGYNLTSGGKVCVISKEARQRMSDARTDKLPVLQYDLDGNFVAEYESTVDAAKAIGSRPGSVWACCVGIATGKRVKKAQVVKGYTYRFKSDYPDVPEHIEMKITDRRKPVAQYSNDGEYVRQWNSIVDAANGLGLPESSIRQCLYGKYKSAGGYQWRLMSTFDKIPNTIEKRPKGNYHCHCTYEQLLANLEVACQKNKEGVARFSLNGEYIDSFDSMKEAAAAVGGDRGTICNACKYKRSKSAFGYLWRRLSDLEVVGAPIAPYVRSYSPINPVLQCTGNGEVVREWPSVTEAAKAMQVNRNTLYIALSGRRGHNKCAGYIWKYKDKQEGC